MTNSQTESGNQGSPWPRIHLLATVCSTAGLAEPLASEDGRTHSGVYSLVWGSLGILGTKAPFCPGKRITRDLMGKEIYPRGGRFQPVVESQGWKEIG